MAVSVGSEPARAKAMSVSSEARPTRAKATPVSRERFVMPAGYGGAWPGTESTHRATHQRPGATVWMAPEGPEGLAAAAVGGGGAWPGFETTRRAELAARTARGRAAAHGRTKQPGPTSQARRHPEHQGSNKQPSNARTPARHSKRGRHQPTPCASALTHP